MRFIINAMNLADFLIRMMAQSLKIHVSFSWRYLPKMSSTMVMVGRMMVPSFIALPPVLPGRTPRTPFQS